MNFDHDFFQVSKLSEDQKKVFTKDGTLFSPNSGEEQKKKKVFTKNGTLFFPEFKWNLRSDAHQSQIIGGDADEDLAQIIGGDTIKLLRGIGGHKPVNPLITKLTFSWTR